jgi:hypothetical protein
MQTVRQMKVRQSLIWLSLIWQGVEMEKRKNGKIF